MKLKFCGLTREADIRAANETRPDYIGFVFAESRRRVTDEQAARLRALLSPGIQAVGVFVNDDPTHIALLANRGVIDLIQLHGSESAAYIQRLRTMTAGAVVGEIALLLGQTRGADVVVEAPSTIHRLTAATLARLEREDPELALLLHRILATTLAQKVTLANRVIEQAAG